MFRTATATVYYRRESVMMIGPEGYYEEYLKGKTAAQIMSAIRGLKNEIGHLKNVMEHPDYEPVVCPSESTRLWCSRLYLERAKEALAEVGGTYTPSQAELRAKSFDDNIPAITRLIFSVGGFFDGFEIRTVDVDAESVTMTISNSIEREEAASLSAEVWSMTKDEFLDSLLDLHIGEWRKHYDTRRFGYDVLDGTSWELQIEFNNGSKPLVFSGNNAYPYSFDAFRDLLGMSSDEEECDTEEKEV